MRSLKLSGTLFLLVVALGFFGCKKTGPAGPRGEQGEQGPKGDQGPQGVAGADGSMIYSDKGTPDAKTGKNGDYYLDKSSGSLYGPKTDKGWGDPVSLKGRQGATGPRGAQGPTGPRGPKGEQGKTGATGSRGPAGKDGADGKDGSQILSGTSTPSSTQGKTGDYYLNTSNFMLYGPKTSSGWGTGVVLRGPKGEKGDPGNANVISSGWLTIPVDHWKHILADNPFVKLPNGGILRFDESGEKEWFVDFPHGYAIANENANGALLLYVDRGFIGFGITATPFKAEFIFHTSPTPQVGAMKFRFVASKRHDSTYIYPVIALMSGYWDVGSIRDVMLKQIKWKVVAIPANVIARKSPPPDPENYKATCEYYGIDE